MGLVAVRVGKRVVTIRNCSFTWALRNLSNPTPSVLGFSVVLCPAILVGHNPLPLHDLRPVCAHRCQILKVVIPTHFLLPLRQNLRQSQCGVRRVFSEVYRPPQSATQ